MKDQVMSTAFHAETATSRIILLLVGLVSTYLPNTV